MKQSVDIRTFVQTFTDYNREDNFSRAGLEALFNYFEELESDIGEEIEFDCIAICCEYTEYESLEEFHKEYDKEEYPDLDTLREYTQVIEVDDDSFIIQVF